MAAILGVSSFIRRSLATLDTTGVIYVVEAFIATAAGNLPLNKALASASGFGEETARIRAHYLKQWKRWNTLRTIASLATCIEVLSS